MIEIKAYHLSYGSKKILKGIDLVLDKGRVLAVVGESGAGKTSLGLSMGCLLGAVKHFSNTGTESFETQGQILFNGKDILQMSEKQLRELRWNHISYVFQNVSSSFNPVLSIKEQVAEPYWVHGLGSKTQALQKAVEMLNKVYFPMQKASHYPHQLSGGELQRALLAMALINDPEVLILDEPTASLDPITRKEILQLLEEITKNRSVLLVTHDLSVASVLSDRTAVLYKGKIIEEGPTDKILSTPHHPYMRALLRSYPHMNTSKDLQTINFNFEEDQEGCVFYSRCTQAWPVCKTESPPLLEFNLPVQLEAGSDSTTELRRNLSSKVACHRGGIVPYLVIHRLTKQYPEGFILQPTSFIIFEGETVALVGESGSGKSTIAKLIMGLEKPDQGLILQEEQKIDFPRRYDFLQKIQLIFQNPYDAVNPRFTVREIVAEPLVVQKTSSELLQEAKVKQVLEEVGLPNTEEFLSRYPSTLSGGELQRVAIARSLILEPKMLIADEPTSALDALVQARILKLLMNLQEKRGLGMLFITHDIAVARKIADRILVLQNGQVVEQGLSWEIITNPRHSYTKELISAAASI